MGAEGVSLKDVPFYRQVEVSEPFWLRQMVGGTQLDGGDVLTVAGCPSYPDDISERWMRVVVFSGKTRQQVAECIVPVDVTVPGKMFGRRVSSTTSYKDSGDDAKWVNSGGDGKYNLEETPEEMGASPMGTEERTGNPGSVISGIG